MNNLLFLFKRFVSGLTLSAIIIFLSVITLWQWPHIHFNLLTPRQISAILEIMPLIPYVFLGIAAILGFRYNNAGLILASVCVLFIYYICSHMAGIPERAIPVDKDFLFRAAVFLFPFNVLWFSLLSKRRLLSTKGILYAAPLIVQIVVILFLVSFHDRSAGSLYSGLSTLSVHQADIFHGIFYKALGMLKNGSMQRETCLKAPFFYSFGFAFTILLLSFFFKAEPHLAGFIGIIPVCFLGICHFRDPTALTIYFLSAGLILVATTIEASFKMAYIDDLTGLPGRRSLNETLLNLGSKYSIAMVDVDHFKKFNDTYGHDTGDQVLKMIATQFGKITGGAKYFRYGGEEFTAVFPGKTIEDAIPHLEQFRKSIQDFPFTVRGKNRPKRKKKGLKQRKKIKTSSSVGKKVKVTVSIGVSGPGKSCGTPDQVIKKADKALYGAKKSGRNCIKNI